MDVVSYKELLDEVSFTEQCRIEVGYQRLFADCFKFQPQLEQLDLRHHERLSYLQSERLKSFVAALSPPPLSRTQTSHYKVVC